MDIRLLFWILGMGITAGTPLLFAAAGEVLSERASVLNLGVEGLMLMGAITGFMVSYTTGNKWIALVAVVIVCAILGAILGVLMITLRTNQIATGIAFTIFCTGLSALIGKPYLGMTVKDTFKKIEFPFLENVEPLRLLFTQDILVYLAIFLAVGSWFFLYKTRPGLHLRASGDNPGALDSLGVNVFRIRYTYLIAGSVMAGLGGAYLSLAYSPSWIENMSAGRGWLVIALVNFAIWNPIHAISGAYLFGVFYAMSFRIEAMGIAVPSALLRMIPYILPILVLILASLRTKHKGSPAPRSLCIPYDREGR